MNNFPPWLWAVLAFVFLLNVLYMWRVLGTLKRLRRWLEAEGWKPESISTLKKDSHFYESDTWWLFSILATDLQGNRRMLTVRVGGLFESFRIVQVTDVIADEKKP